jgi:hypothetical protein
MRRLCPLLPVLLLAACGSNPLFLRLGADYYPVTSIGSQWEYEVEGGGYVITSVVDQTVVGERSCYRLQTGADYSYWSGEDGRLDHYEDHTVIFNGFEVPVFQAWVTYLDWPLCIGASRIDSVTTYATSQGVTISHSWRRETMVAGIGTFGQWDECYLLEQEERTIDWVQTGGFAPETVVVNRSLWLAPDVGLVRKVTPDSTLTLTSFVPGV